MWNPFKTKKTPVISPVPEIGSVWESKHENPFRRHQVVVREISEGYVKFRGVELYMGYTCSLESFLSGFKEINKVNS